LQGVHDRQHWELEGYMSCNSTRQDPLTLPRWGHREPQDLLQDPDFRRACSKRQTWLKLNIIEEYCLVLLSWIKKSFPFANLLTISIALWRWILPKLRWCRCRQRRWTDSSDILKIFKQPFLNFWENQVSPRWRNYRTQFYFSTPQRTRFRHFWHSNNLGKNFKKCFFGCSNKPNKSAGGWFFHLSIEFIFNFWDLSSSTLQPDRSEPKFEIVKSFESCLGKGVSRLFVVTTSACGWVEVWLIAANKSLAEKKFKDKKKLI